MFSLIITAVSIALVIVLAIATIYYGGTSSTQAAAKAAAGTLINQSMQIHAAGTIAVAQGTGWPADRPYFAQPYLEAMPVPPKSAYANSGDTPSANDWTYYLDPNGTVHSRHFVLKNKISRNVCMAVNKAQGLIGIPAVWDGSSLIQCFGPGVSAQPGGEMGYTYFFSPTGTTDTENTAVLDQSKTEGGSTTPGYPRLCPDGTSITTGLCPDTTPSGGGGNSEPSGPRQYHVIPTPGYLDTQGHIYDGSSYVSYCSTDVPVGTFDLNSVVTVAGVPLITSAVWDSDGAACIDVYDGHPAEAPGTYPIVVTTTDGGTATGTIQYIAAFSAAPTVDGISPDSTQYDTPVVATISGTGFKPGAVVYAGWARILESKFIDSEHLEVKIPVASEFGYTDGWSRVFSVQVENPSSAVADFFPSFAFTEGSGGGTPTQPTGPGPGSGPAPTLTSLSVGNGEYYSSTSSVAYGSGFLPGVAARINGRAVQATYVDGNTVQLVIPPAGYNTDAEMAAAGPDHEFTPEETANYNMSQMWLQFDGQASNWYKPLQTLEIYNPGSQAATAVFTYGQFWKEKPGLYLGDGSSNNDVVAGGWATLCAPGGALAVDMVMARVDGSYATWPAWHTQEGSNSCIGVNIPSSAPKGNVTIRVRASDYYIPYPAEYNWDGGVNANCPNCTEYSRTVNVL